MGIMNGDLKIICMPLEQLGGYMKYPCFLCAWDGREEKQH